MLQKVFFAQDGLNSTGRIVYKTKWYIIVLLDENEHNQSIGWIYDYADKRLPDKYNRPNNRFWTVEKGHYKLINTKPINIRDFGKGI